MENRQNTRLSDTTDPNVLYQEQIEENQEHYKGLMESVAENEKAQKAQQEAATNQTLAQLEDTKAQVQEDSRKEQSAAYTDYQKQVDPYGVESEKLADGGMTGSGYSESAKVSMYNTYQNRVAVAKASCDQAVREYDLAIAEAKRLNSAALAEIAYDSFVQRMELAMKARNQDMQLKLEWEDLRQEEAWDTQKAQLQEYAAMLAQAQQENQDFQALFEQNVQESSQKLQEAYDLIRQLQDEVTRYKTGQALDGQQTPDVPRPEGPFRLRSTTDDKTLNLWD